MSLITDVIYAWRNRNLRGSTLPVAKAMIDETMPQWLRDEAASQKYTLPDPTLESSQLSLYQQLSWFSIAVNIVSSMAATTALEVGTLGSKTTDHIDNHEFELLLARPNPLQSRFELLQTTFAYYLVTGNAYWWLNRTSPYEKPVEMWSIAPEKLRPVPDGQLYLKGYLYDSGIGPLIPLEPWEVVHFKTFNPRTPFLGLSPVEALAEVSLGDLAMQRWNTAFFDENNAKMPGALAFADAIPDPQWKQMKDDINEQHGGTRRSLMMLRNVGAGGVQWVSTAMSQKDMEFLQARQSSKEEIWAMIAPGLSSTLAINATEANSIAGRATLLEMAIWPKLVAFSEKITNDIMPVYGERTVAKFEDIRHSDKTLELAEQTSFAAVHTVDEIRAEYYGDKPIGDDRGKLLPAQISQGTFGVVEPPPQLAMIQPEDQQIPVDSPGTNTQPVEKPVPNEPANATAAEIAKFKRWATSPRRNGRPDAMKFESQILSDEEKLLLLNGWKLLRIKASVPLNPIDLEAEQKLRMAVEERAQKEIARALAEQRQALIPDGATTIDADEIILRIGQSGNKVRDALIRMLRESVDLGVKVGVAQLANSGFGFDWTLVNVQAREWAGQHALELVQGLDATTERAVREAIVAWIDNGLPLDDLIRDLETVFGPARARLIAVTEVTQAYARGQREAFLASGVVTQWQWATAADELVCPVCGDFDGRVVDIDSDFGYGAPPEVRDLMRADFIAAPPAHVNCRCWVVPYIQDFTYRVRPDGTTTTFLDDVEEP